ncbi:hypothetical protein HMPREF0650_1426 [Hoylesella buccalis ATCC 35310]|uniref:Uncharacterized protein n=1 Tax=Hoylesella buccalis ATCC 35310 TaxID=679190 RepID=D1W4N0_9BACT|nr:hypothetical protein HMPREF0650_1426 [Hoylesella buccalis ATCC 35310]
MLLVLSIWLRRKITLPVLVMTFFLTNTLSNFAYFSATLRIFQIMKIWSKNVLF